MKKRDLEGFMLTQLRASGYDKGMETQYRFHPKRKWTFDFAWPDKMVALEVEGAIWVRGRHTSGTGFTNDCEKYNTATIMGWRVIRVVADWIVDRDGNMKGDALKYIEWIFRAPGRSEI
jgi:hypothetical protein